MKGTRPWGFRRCRVLPFGAPRLETVLGGRVALVELPPPFFLLCLGVGAALIVLLIPLVHALSRGVLPFVELAAPFFLLGLSVGAPLIVLFVPFVHPALGRGLPGRHVGGRLAYQGDAGAVQPVHRMGILVSGIGGGPDRTAVFVNIRRHVLGEGGGG